MIRYANEDEKICDIRVRESSNFVTFEPEDPSLPMNSRTGIDKVRLPTRLRKELVTNDL